MMLSFKNRPGCSLSTSSFVIVMISIAFGGRGYVMTTSFFSDFVLSQKHLANIASLQVKLLYNVYLCFDLLRVVVLEFLSSIATDN